MGQEILAEDSDENRMVLSMLLEVPWISPTLPTAAVSPKHPTSPYRNECVLPQCNYEPFQSIFKQKPQKLFPGASGIREGT